MIDKGASWKIKVILIELRRRLLFAVGIVIIVMGRATLLHIEFNHLIRTGVRTDAIVTRCSNYGKGRLYTSMGYEYLVVVDGEDRTISARDRTRNVLCNDREGKSVEIMYNPNFIHQNAIVKNKFSEHNFKFNRQLTIGVLIVAWLFTTSFKTRIKDEEIRMVSRTPIEWSKPEKEGLKSSDYVEL